MKGHTMTNSVGGTYGQYMDYRSDTYPKGRTTTGYYLRKYLDESHTDFSVIKVSTQTWVELRLAEIYSSVPRRTIVWALRGPLWRMSMP